VNQRRLQSRHLVNKGHPIPEDWQSLLNSPEPRTGQISHLSPQPEPIVQQQSVLVTGTRPPISHLNPR